MINYFKEVKLLSDPNYEVREKATQNLIKLWPLCRGSILIGSQSADPEIRYRCLQIDREGAAKLFGKRGQIFRGITSRPENKHKLTWLWKVQPDLVRWEMVDYALKDTTQKTMLALYLIICPFDDNCELPWCPDKIHAKYCKDIELRTALCDLVNHTWKYPNGDKIWLACDPLLKQSGVAGYLMGLDNVRFWARHLIDPSFGNPEYNKQNKKKWAETKDEKYKEFEWKWA